ncbi:MAG: hypothetical protein QOE90_3710 [Thermoplasmata archaeon]|jgi:hypothetical protein|nr:hypothetical protein [Thermoplasmata archaeon]
MIVLALALLLSGCLGGAPLPLQPLSVAQPATAYTWPAPVAYDGNGTARPVPADVVKGIEQLVPGTGAEPNVGVTSKGSLFVTTLDQVRRSTDHGKTWKVVEDLVTPGAPLTDDQFGTSDPMMWVDAGTDRVFANQMHPALLCTWMSWSDDDGNTWTERPLDCATPGLDHQKVMTAPPPATIPRAPGQYPSLVYMCVNKMLDTGLGGLADGMGTSCMTSFDGGLSFPLEREVYVNDHLCSNINGHPAAFPDGTVALVLGNLGGTRCERPLTVVLSEDGGVTWSVRQCDPKLGQLEIDADITVTPDGTAYLLYRDHDEMTHLLRSKDKFQTCQSFRVAPPGQTLDEFTAITSGADGRLAMAYVGTRDPQDPGASPSNATLGSAWHLFVTTVDDAESASPTFVTTQVTPNEDPVQVGCIWLEGGGGGPHGCRNLLDFIDMVHDKDGRWYVAFTDGCVPRNGCAGNVADVVGGQSRERQVGVAVQVSGPSLTGKGDVAPLDLAPPMPLPRD